MRCLHLAISSQLRHVTALSGLVPPIHFPHHLQLFSRVFPWFQDTLSQEKTLSASSTTKHFVLECHDETVSVRPWASAEMWTPSARYMISHPLHLSSHLMSINDLIAAHILPFSLGWLSGGENRRQTTCGTICFLNSSFLSTSLCVLWNMDIPFDCSDGLGLESENDMKF